MSDIVVRTVTDDEVPAYVESMEAGFHHVTRDGFADWIRPQIEIDKTIAAFDGSDVVGTSRWFETELTLPGGSTIPVAAVTEVTVTATHRRQGLLTRMMEAQREDFVTRSLAAAVLIAAEAPIYGRFGYGMATEDASLIIQVPLARFTVPTPAGSVRRCTPADLVAEAPAIYDRYRRATPGAIQRNLVRWDYFVNRPPGEEKRAGDEFRVLRRDASGAADGFAWYRIKEEWKDRVPNGTIEIDDMVAASDDAYVALWQHCLSVDWVKTVKANGRPAIEPLPFMLEDRRAAVQKVKGDFLWLRIIDPVTALGARRYRVADRLVLRVDDRFGGPASGTYALDGGPDGAKCEATLDDPDLSVEIGDLSASYLGGTPLWPAARARRVTEHRAGALAAFDRMFEGDVPPWCNTDF